MRYQLLGSLQVETDKGPIELGPPKQRSVLAVLLLNANEIVPTDRIIDLVWGESPPRTAGHSVQIYISDLRKALANGSRGEVIETRPPGYVLKVPADSIDAFRFQRLVREGVSAVRSGDVAGGRTKLETALDVWTASPLVDFAYEDFAQGHIRSLEELRSDALEALGAIHLDEGDPQRARELARQAIEADPLREEPRRLMMLALYRSGRQAEALRHFGGYETAVAEELGIEPSPGLRDLEERILLQDPSLDVEASVTSEGNPYRGLRAFSEDDAEVYFGRENLVEEVLERLRSGPGFVSIVGPSGSGKSSAARAGVIPRLRQEGETVVVFQPGPRPLWELAGALDRAGFGSRASLLHRFESDSSSLSTSVTRSVVLIVDQFEELFTLAEPDVARRFSELVAAAVRDRATPLRVVATLRADYYDRPLSMPPLAGVFSDSVVSVKPMSPREIERAVVEPARAAGVAVEPALLAQIIADMGDEPGALPLLQVTLFELFEKTSNGLTLKDYLELEGLHGALTGGADDLLAELDPEGRDLAEQLMMRMVQKGRALSTSRPVLVRELLDLGVDSVALQGVLEAFGSRRLITFDRDGSGAAVVEMAHEFLISEWPQLEAWIEEHSDDLDRLYAVERAAADWVAADRSEDYLLRGDRLDTFESWRESTSLLLTRTESQFIDASVKLRERQEAEQREQAAKQRALERRARHRLWAFGAAVAGFAAAVTFLVVTLIPEPPPDVVASYEGDAGFAALIDAGIEAGLEGTGLSLGRVGTSPSDIEELYDYAAAGTGFILTEGTLQSHDVEALLEENPDVVIGFLECTGQPFEDNPQVWCVTPANHELGFLAGAAAGLATTTDRVGIVLGVNTYNMLHFQAGFEQGVRRTNADARIDAVYLSSYWPYVDLTGFGSVALGRVAALEMYERGADVIFAAAGYSNKGVHEAAVGFTGATGAHVWSIGADDDEWSFYEGEWWPAFTEEEESVAYLSERGELIQDHILTSVEKRNGVGIALLIQAYARGESEADVELTVANGALGFSSSGGHLISIQPELDQIVEDLAMDRIDVSREPDGEAPLIWEWFEADAG